MLVRKCQRTFYKLKSERLIAEKLAVADKLVTTERFSLQSN